MNSHKNGSELRFVDKCYLRHSSLASTHLTETERGERDREREREREKKRENGILFLYQLGSLAL